MYSKCTTNMSHLIHGEWDVPLAPLVSTTWLHKIRCECMFLQLDVSTSTNESNMWYVQM